MLQACPHAEDAPATRPIDGVGEKVFYYGEEIGTRRSHGPRVRLSEHDDLEIA